MEKELTSKGRVIVVSNRLPVTLKRVGNQWRGEKSAGGLATAMNPILQRSKGIWIGWTGDASGARDEKRQEVINRWREEDGYIAVDLPPETAAGFYEGFSNQTLWFLFHHFPGMLKYYPDQWRDYVKANEIFRDAVLEHLQPDDLIWVHDYQLMLLPQMIREKAPDAKIGFFLHIPFPSSSVFRILPRRAEILNGLLGADYIAFHTHTYLQNFRNSVLRVLGMNSKMDRIEMGSRFIRLEAQPIGIAPENFTNALKEEATQENLSEMRERFQGQKIILGVDRLDYTKGLPARLQAYRRLLRARPDLRGKITFIQVAVPSRERITLYKELRQEVDELVGKINGEWSTPEWTPIIYMRRNLPFNELTALYKLADVAWVSPLRDGFNLVAKEYVACQPDGDGILVLSEFAGAAAEMGEALFINPYDEQQSAEIIAKALELPEAERRERMQALYRRVRRNNVFSWGERFIANLNEAVSWRLTHSSETPEKLSFEDVVNAFSKAEKRLIMLDYDGTLVGYANRPQDAVPSENLLRLLEKLANTRNTHVTVVSGRSRPDLEKWFGQIKNLSLAAEHGAVIRTPDTPEWEQTSSYSIDWKERVSPVLEHYADRTPGSFIEEKEFSLVWHYRMSDPKFGEWLANELVSTLEGMLAETDLQAVRGRKTVEVKLLRANKGEIFERLNQTYPDADFLLAAGDDTTDEDLFAQMPDSAWTIHVGKKQSRARFRLSDFEEMHQLLSYLVNGQAKKASY
jgi:trehalose 6-phosphate synthase/phosphatase